MTGITLFNIEGESKELEYLTEAERNVLLAGMTKDQLILWVNILCGQIVRNEDRSEFERLYRPKKG